MSFSFTPNFSSSVGAGASKDRNSVPKFKSTPPPSLPISPPSFFSIPHVLSPAELLDSPVLLSSSNAISTLISPSDAKIVVAPGKEISVHRCILASRSPYLKSAFTSHKDKEKGARDGSGAVRFELKDLARDCEVGFDALVTILAYLYSGKINPSPKNICVCVDNGCSHLGCRPAVEFMTEVLYLSFTFQITELISLYQRRVLDIVEKITPDDFLIILTVADICKTDCERLHMQCVEILVNSDVDNIALEKLLPMHIANLIMDERKEVAQIKLYNNNSPDKHVKRIHRALDLDDVELVFSVIHYWLSLTGKFIYFHS